MSARISKVVVSTTAGKRKKPTDTYRHFVMRGSHLKRRGGNGKNILKDDGFAPSRHHAWLRREAGAYLSACVAGFKSGGVFGVWEDGSRLGNPAVEYVVSFGYSCGDNKGCVLPPQVAKPGAEPASSGTPSPCVKFA